MTARKKRGLFYIVVCALSLAAFSGCARQGSPQEVVITAAPTAAAPAATPTPAFMASASPGVPDEPSPAPSPALSPAASPTPAATKKPKQPLSGLIIGVDPGHQAHADREQEPVAPGSSATKNKVSSGTRGVKTGVYEYEVNLAVGLLLRDMLEEAGATVVITHTEADVNISNIERARFFNDNKVNLGVRLHCNGSEDKSVRGAFMLVPKSKDYPYYDDCVLAAKAILKAYGEATGIDVKKGITYRSDQTGFNWCDRPVTNIEMGHMTNPDEDLLLTDEAFQVKMARGIFNGIVAYFEAKDRG